MTTQQSLERTYLTKAESAAYIRRSVRFVDYLVAHGELRPFRPGRKLLFLRSDLDAYVQRYRVEPGLDRIVNETVAEVLGATK
jgi:excisionase family DNA binding protein